MGVIVLALFPGSLDPRLEIHGFGLKPARAPALCGRAYNDWSRGRAPRDLSPLYLLPPPRQSFLSPQKT